MEINKMKIDILGISKIKWPNPGDFWSGDYRIIHTGTAEKRPDIGGVGLIVNKTLGEKVKGYIQYNERIILVRFQTKPKNTIVAQVYMPTTNSSEEELEEVYENLDKLIESVKGEENLIVMGDWNAIVGEEKVKNITGDYGLGNWNDRGDQLLEFCAKHKLIITNTCFNHLKRRRYTWKMPGDINRYQIDYIMVKNRFRNKVKESRSYQGTDINSDHNLVMMKCNLKFKKITCKKKMVQWQVKNLKDEKSRKQYSECTNEVTIEDPLEPQNIEERWQNLKQTITKIAVKTLLHKNIAARKDWITAEIVNLIEERRKYKILNSTEGQERYKALRNLVIRKSKEAKEKYLEENCSDIEILMKTGRREDAYKMVKKFFEQYKPRAGGIEDNNGKMLWKQEYIVKIWKEYLEILYEGETFKEIESKEEEEYEKDPVMREEFDKALKNLKNKKAAGIDGIQAELWKEAGEKVKNRLFQITRDIYVTGEMPEDYIKSIIIPIPKKAPAKKCEKFRTISLLSHASKILTKIIFQRIESKIEQSLTDDQFGFRKNRGTREAILALRIIIQKRIRKNKQTFIAFVDIENAFDNVNWKLMFDMMTRVGIKQADRKLLTNYTKTSWRL